MTKTIKIDEEIYENLLSRKPPDYTQQQFFNEIFTAWLADKENKYDVTAAEQILANTDRILDILSLSRDAVTEAPAPEKPPEDDINSKINRLKQRHTGVIPWNSLT